VEGRGQKAKGKESVFSFSLFPFQGLLMREGTNDVPAGGKSVWCRIFEKSPELSAVMVDNAGPVAIVDAKQAIAYRNAALDELLSAHGIRQCTSLPFGCDDCRSRFAQALGSALAGQNVTVPNLCLASPSGTTATISARLVGLKSRKGTEFAAAFIADKTDIVRLKDRAALLDEFAQIGLALPFVGHKMNNHLAAILGFSKLLMDTGHPSHTDLQTILDAGSNCRLLTDRYFRFASERCKADRIDPNQIIRSAAGLLAGDMALRSITCTLNLEQNLPSVNVAAVPMEQALLNMVNRACNAMPSGGTLVIQSRKIMADRPAPAGEASAGLVPQVEILVADTGREIVEPELSALFEPISFSPGTGRRIGLVGIANVLITHQRASLNLVKTAPEGSTFAIRIAVHQDVPASGHAPVKPPIPRASGRSAKTILVVDDDEMCRKLLAETLARDGHFVDTAPDGQTALARIERTAYDIIIADIRMPGMGGDQLYAEVAKRNPQLAPKIMFITGDNLSADTQDFLSGIPNPVLVKPFAIDELLVAVKNL